MSAKDEEFRTYVDARGDALLRTAVGLVGNRQQAEDLLQDALAKTYVAWDRVRAPEARDAYVRQVMVRTRTTWWRRRRWREVAAADPGADVGEPWADDPTRRVDDADHVERLLHGLPPRQRAALVLRFLDDLSEEQTAQVMGVSRGTVKSTTSRALAHLRERVGDEPAAGAPADPRTTTTTEATR